MKILNKQNFWDKLFMFSFILLIIKLISILISFFYLPASEVFLDLLLFLIIGFVILLSSIGLKSGKFSSGSRSGFGGFFGLGSSRGGSAYVGNDLFNKIYQKYTEAAKKYAAEGEYKKAANIYLRLLQDPHQAALTLKDGKFYSEAAVIYLKKLDDKKSAAECYEKGLEYGKAIQLHTELENFEKVGDLYKIQNNIPKARHFYQIVIDDYFKKNQFVKASLVHRYKMEQAEAAQNMLKSGWEKNYDAYNCLNNYFQNIADPKLLEKEITHFYKVCNHERKEVFLKVLKVEYKKHADLQDKIKEIGYEIIAERAEKNPAFVSEIKFFSEKDMVIYKDITLYKSPNSKILR
ncbi:soluble NSF attachment family protein [Frigoriflavimonas asaccharolytica]|uniref:Tetratricopeptide (TPR) repeat protein n=1 Tax=Frigoriflavimonas asaccharolytica TaxID=2735899 RepID=A0A8J8G973_9FLAO|nr:hypothetical protein [Frigoriflavimonas asaccharolytica]NRS93654.1 tetratricopeptide (TPR) repeat protein [Frigoriflavimonas asaccharolytica]